MKLTLTLLFLIGTVTVVSAVDPLEVKTPDAKDDGIDENALDGKTSRKWVKSYYIYPFASFISANHALPPKGGIFAKIAPNCKRRLELF